MDLHTWDDLTRRRWLKTLARLRRVNFQLAAWDELEAGQLPPQGCD